MEAGYHHQTTLADALSPLLVASMISSRSFVRAVRIGVTSKILLIVHPVKNGAQEGQTQKQVRRRGREGQF